MVAIDLNDLNQSTAKLQTRSNQFPKRLDKPAFKKMICLISGMK